MAIQRKFIFRLIKVLLMLYGIIGILFYYLQEKILLHPEKLPASYQFKFKQPFEEVNIAMNLTDTINMIRFYSDSNTAKGLVVYFHGNTQNVEHYASYASFFTKRGYEVWMPDYPGFGKSTGSIDEKKLYSQADQVIKLALTKFGNDSLIIYGKSFGTGIAAYVASYIKPNCLILEAPYYSIPSLFRNYLFLYPVTAMSKYKLPVGEYLEDVKNSVVIFHGKKDCLIPYREAAQLKEVMKLGDRFVTIDKGSHNDLTNFDGYKLVMDSILR